MPNINDINGVTVANLAKLDAVLKANISKVNGLTLSAAAAFLLDTYTGAAAAYSTRKLKTGVTVAARIRRSGDDIEADVEFDSNNEISLTSPISNASSGTYTDLADFVDHSTTPRDAFVDEWKDQSGSGNHAAQATAGNQPKLYDATTGLVTENGKPAIQFDGINDRLDAGDNGDTTGDLSIFGVGQSVITGAHFGALISKSAAAGVPNRWSASLRRSIYADSTNASTTLDMTQDYTQQLASYIYLGASSMTIYQDGSQDVTASLSGSAGDNSYHLLVGGYGDSTGTGGVYNVHSGTIQEVVYYNADQSSNRTGIEENINSEYLIYQPTDAPTSGLLATYTGAAAAYSVRQLSDKAVIALRIRRDSDDEEKNIGFDSNGDLDTTAISDFCQTANGYVTRWWDQSTNSEHANQDTDTLQPQIYNGTSVFTNGSPARPEIRATTNARMVLGTLAHDVDRKYFAATTASVSSFCVLFGSNNTADYELLAQSGSTSSIFDGGGAIVNRNGSLWYDAPTLDKDRDDVWTDFSNQSIVMIDHVMAVVTGRTTQLGYATNGIPMFHMQELIIYPTGTSHAVSDIENAINSYFQVYT